MKIWEFESFNNIETGEIANERQKIFVGPDRWEVQEVELVYRKGRDQREFQLWRPFVQN